MDEYATGRQSVVGPVWQCIYSAGFIYQGYFSSIERWPKIITLQNIQCTPRRRGGKKDASFLYHGSRRTYWRGNYITGRSVALVPRFIFCISRRWRAFDDVGVATSVSSSKVVQTSLIIPRWDIRGDNTGRPMHDIWAHKAEANCVGFCPGSEWILATGSSDKVTFKEREWTPIIAQSTITAYSWFFP